MAKFRRPISSVRLAHWSAGAQKWLARLARRRGIGVLPTTIALSCVIGILGGLGAVLFTALIKTISYWSVEQVLGRSSAWWLALLCVIPALGLLAVSWLTRRFAPEAQGHGVPEVIMAVARNDGVIRPRVSVVKIVASGLCIGTGGSVGREGPIVQIGSSLGSAAGQLLKLPPRSIKVLVAAGSAAGISATFNAPLAGVVFASEIILGSFAVESLTPIVIASVLADVVRQHVGQHGSKPAFEDLNYVYLGAWGELPTYFALGLLCGLAAVGFTKLLYKIEDWAHLLLPAWWLRALVCGMIMGTAGLLYPTHLVSPMRTRMGAGHKPIPPLFGVGYPVIDQVVRLQWGRQATGPDPVEPGSRPAAAIRPAGGTFFRHLGWLVLLALLKPLATSITLGGGGSGGIFAPSFFSGAALGASFGLVCNLVFPGVSANPGVYAIVGMGAVVAGTTHGMLSAILIVYELTGDYRIILPIMVAAGLSTVVARFFDPDSIYHKKLTRRGVAVARGYEAHRLEHIMVRDVMIRHFPTVRRTDNLAEIVRVARANPTVESLPVMNDKGLLLGIIRPEDLHRVLDTDVAPELVYAEDIALQTPLAVSPDENLLEALRDFGSSDVETLPVEVGQGESRRVVGLLLRADVMRRYRQEMLAPR